MGIIQFKLVKELLDSNRMLYEVYEHEPVYTSEQAARVRGVELKSGVKALLLRKEGEVLLWGWLPPTEE